MNMRIFKRLYPAMFLSVFSPFIHAKECFDVSPMVEKGDDIYIDQIVPKLSVKHYDNINKILKSATGQWTGSMMVKECFGTKSSLTTRQEAYEVKAASEFDGELFELKLDLYSQQSKKRKATSLKYSLTDDSFSIDTRQTGNAEVLTTTSTGVTYYKRFRQIQAGKPGSFVKETSYVLEASGREIVIKEYQYINGELVAESILQLE